MNKRIENMKVSAYTATKAIETLKKYGKDRMTKDLSDLALTEINKIRRALWRNNNVGI